MKTLVLVLLASSTLYSAEPVQPKTRGLLGSGPVVTVRQRTLAEVAKEKPTKPGTVSQMDASVPAYQAPQLLSATSGPAPVSVGGAVVNVTSAPGTTHAPPIVGRSVEEQRGEKR